MPGTAELPIAIPKMKKQILFLLLISGLACAEQTKTKYNSFTGKLDYITALSTNSIKAGSNITVSTTALGVTITGTGAGGTPSSPLSSVQYNNAGAFGGSSSFQFNGTSVTITSSATFHHAPENSVLDNTPVGLVDIFDGDSWIGKPLFTIGSNQGINRFTVNDGTALDLTNLGANIGCLAVGSNSDVLYSCQSSNNFINIYSGQGINGRMVLQTNTLNQPIVLQPGAVPTAAFYPSSTTITYGVTVGSISINTGGSSGKAMCWKTAILPGFCSSVIGVGGDCTCN